jgi:hypothetical protein
MKKFLDIRLVRRSVGVTLAGALVALVGSAAQAQQSFSFSFGSSSSFSSGSQPSKELKSPGEDSSTNYPSSARNGFRNAMSKSITNVNGHIVEKSFEDRDGKIVSVTRVLNGKQDVLIEESDELGIKVTIKESIRGKEKKSEYQAEDRKALRKKHPAAFEWVRKYASEPTHANAAGAMPNPMANPTPNGVFANGGFSFGGAAGNANGANAQGGAFSGPQAQQMMIEQIEQMIKQTDDPNLKQQMRGMIDQLRKETAEPKR